jgi:hypothetical protein
MIRLQLSLELDYEVFAPGCVFIFNIHAAHTERQQVSTNRNAQWTSPNETDPATRTRYCV